jgi:hypothetical protein
MRLKLSNSFAISLVISAALAPLLLGGCGGSSTEVRSQTRDQTESAQVGAGSSAAKFLTNENKELVEFGEEADGRETRSASQILEQNMHARAAGDWSDQCSTLSRGAIKSVTAGATSDVEQSCAGALRALGQPLPKTRKARADTLAGPISALRVLNDQAYALFHGTDGSDYAMPMKLEAGEWKVDSLLTIKIG